MNQSQLLTRSLTLFAFLGVVACSTAPRVDLPAGSDPQVKITETSARLNSDQMKQDTASIAKHFSMAQKDLAEARENLEKGASSEEVLAISEKRWLSSKLWKTTVKKTHKPWPRFFPLAP